MTTPRKPRTERACWCGCGEPVPLARRPQARYVNQRHKNLHEQRKHRARKKETP